MGQGISDICEQARDEAKERIQNNPDYQNIDTKDLEKSEIAIAAELAKGFSEAMTTKIGTEGETLKTRIEMVNKLNRLKRLINAAKRDGAIDLEGNEELKQLFEEVSKMDLNFDQEAENANNPEYNHTEETIPGMNKSGGKYTKEETDNLMDSLSSAISDLNQKNDMQSTRINRFYNQLNEGFATARMMLDTHKRAVDKIIAGMAR